MWCVKFEETVGGVRKVCLMHCQVVDRSERQDRLRLHRRGRGARQRPSRSLWHHALDITAHTAEAAKLHLAFCHGEAHITDCLVLTPRYRFRSESRPFTCLLLLPLLRLLPASLMRPPTCIFLLLAKSLPDVTAGISLDDTV